MIFGGLPKIDHDFIGQNGGFEPKNWGFYRFKLEIGADSPKFWVDQQDLGVLVRTLNAHVLDIANNTQKIWDRILGCSPKKSNDRDLTWHLGFEPVWSGHVKTIATYPTESGWPSSGASPEWWSDRGLLLLQLIWFQVCVFFFWRWDWSF